MNVLERVKNLIARSESNHVEEARTSAFMACKLIREHKLVVSLPSDSRPAAAPARPTTEDLAREYMRRQQQAPRDPFAEHFRGWRDPQPRRDFKGKKTWGEGWVRAKNMVRRTTCVCDAEIPPGKEFWVKPDRAPLCDKCYEKFNQPV